MESGGIYMRKNVLLISPHSSAKLNESRYVSPAPGIIRLAAYLNSNGHYAEAYDPNLHDLNNSYVDLHMKLLEEDWDIIGVSCLEETLVQDIENLWTASKLRPQALLVAGGIEAQYNYQTILDKSPCKIVVTGEGEVPMEMICNDTLYQNIPGIIFKNNADPLTKEQFEFASKQIPWGRIPYEDYWDYYLDKYEGKITDEINDQIHTVRIFSKNRCPFLCKFCTSTNQLPDAIGRKASVVGISTELLVTFIETIHRMHPRVRTIYLTDDDFCINRIDVIEFCKQIIERKLDHLTYMCFARVTDLKLEMLQWMKKAGFRRLNIGVESFSNKVLEEIGKKYTEVQIVENLIHVKAVGIQAFLTAMLITPGSNLLDLEYTVHQLSQYAKDPFFTLGLAPAIRPTKGSEFYEMYHDFKTITTPIKGIRSPNKRPYLIKENKMIYAKDPYVKEIQILYDSLEEKFLDEFINKNNIKHATYSNIAEAQLKLMKDCIENIKDKYNLP